VREEPLAGTVEIATRTRWADYLKPLRFDHWIKNAVVPVGSLLAIVAHRLAVEPAYLVDIGLAFVISGGISSVNYAINEVLDAPFDARHPAKRFRPIPSGRVRVAPLLGLTAGLALVTLAMSAWLFRPPFLLANVALFVAGLLYNLPPVRLKDWPFLDALVESLTNPIRIAIGWYAVAPATTGLPAGLLVTVWAFGAFLMTGKRLAELRLLGPLAAEYRPTFRAYTVRGLLAVQLAYALAGLAALAVFFAAERPRLLMALPLVAGLLGWAVKMTFERESPLIDPEHLYRRPGFLLVSCAVLATLVALAV
jgi:4-hydroxybenzoate polyprenyltransferase